MYVKFHHNIYKLLYKLYSDGTIIFLRREDALRINGLNLSPQHHANFKGKPEGRIIRDLSGHHDQNFTPLNGSAHDKDQLRADIALKWGEIKHPTLDQFVKMVLTSSYGAFNLLNYNPDFCKWFAFPLTDAIHLYRYATCFSSVYTSFASILSSYY